MNSETKQCANCHKNFVIEPEDFDYYQKISVPAPTWCPECRLQRRLMFRNEKSFYKSRCAAPGHDEMLVSMYPENSGYVVYDAKTWWSDAWDPMVYGREYDFSKPFFEQFRELAREVPRIAIMNKNSQGSDYCNNVSDHKNCYLEIGGYNSEGVMYSNTAIFTKDSSDLFFVANSERCYELLDSTNCYHVRYGRYCNDCLDSMFLYDCKGCQHCFGCIGLRNKKYYIFNKPYTKEEYAKKLEEFDVGSFQQLELLKGQFRQQKLAFPMRMARIARSENVSGDNIQNSKNCTMCFDVNGGKEFGNGEGAIDSKFLVISGWNTASSYDCMQIGGNMSLSYELVSGAVGVYRAKFSHVCWTNTEVDYADNCHNCDHLFGCISLRNKKYCILNKQYTKEEYEALIPKIKQHMMDMPFIDQKGRTYAYGEFFPPELSPFAYNETIAQEYFPLTKEEAQSQGYAWKDPDTKGYTITKKPEDLPDHINDVPDSILKETIGCAHKGQCVHQCTTAFKIIPSELQFYKQTHLPLPRLCPNCRHYERLAQRNPLKLWKRKCQCGGAKSENGAYQNIDMHRHGDKPCPNEFETSYAPDRPEIVYCEQCYQAETI